MTGKQIDEIRNMPDDKFAIRCEDVAFVADVLSEHQEWRLGRGKFAWSEEPAENREMPLSPHQLTIALDAVINRLKASTVQAEKDSSTPN